MSGGERRVELGNVALLTAKELREAWRNRWFLLYAAVFTALALAMSWLSVHGELGVGFAGFGRTAASLVNLVVLIVPLMGLTLGAAAVAAERERGSLLYLLAQPVSQTEVVLGKFCGLASAMVASLLLGFGVAGVVIARRAAAGDVVPFLAFLGLATLVASAAVAVGLLVSTLADRAAVAGGIALFLWLAAILLGDLGLMGTSLVLQIDVERLLAAALLNPLQEFKLAAMLVLRGGLEVLGPAGLFAVRSYGAALLPGLVGALLLWTVAPLTGAVVVLRRRGAL